MRSECKRLGMPYSSVVCNIYIILRLQYDPWVFDLQDPHSKNNHFLFQFRAVPRCKYNVHKFIAKISKNENSFHWRCECTRSNPAVCRKCSSAGITLIASAV